MEQPQEVEDEDYERTWERVAAVDVAKATGVVCTWVPDGDRPGRRLPLATRRDQPGLAPRAPRLPYACPGWNGFRQLMPNSLATCCPGRS